MAAAGPPLVTSVQVQNYKSIAKCNVTLGPLSFVVGPNGSGKSNFVDAIRFVADALNTTLENAFRERGGIQSVRRRSRGHPNHFGVGLRLALPDGRPALYAFKVGAEAQGGFVVQREECRVEPYLHLRAQHFVVERGRVVDASRDIPTAVEPDRLGLVAISGLPEFRPVYEALKRMAFYSPQPATHPGTPGS